MVKKSIAYPWERIAGFTFGVLFLIVLLVLTFTFSDMKPQQYATVKTILALAAAGVGGILTGFIQVKGKIQNVGIRAGGALALFVIVFFFTPKPPEFINETSQLAPIHTQTIIGNDGVIMGNIHGVVTIGRKSQSQEAQPK